MVNRGEQLGSWSSEQGDEFQQFPRQPRESAFDLTERIFKENEIPEPPSPAENPDQPLVDRLEQVRNRVDEELALGNLNESQAAKFRTQLGEARTMIVNRRGSVAEADDLNNRRRAVINLINDISRAFPSTQPQLTRDIAGNDQPIKPFEPEIETALQVTFTPPSTRRESGPKPEPQPVQELSPKERARANIWAIFGPLSKSQPKSAQEAPPAGEKPKAGPKTTEKPEPPPKEKREPTGPVELTEMDRIIAHVIAKGRKGYRQKGQRRPRPGIFLKEIYLNPQEIATIRELTRQAQDILDHLPRGYEHRKYVADVIRAVNKTRENYEAETVEKELPSTLANNLDELSQFIRQRGPQPAKNHESANPAETQTEEPESLAINSIITNLPGREGIWLVEMTFENDEVWLRPVDSQTGHPDLTHPPVVVNRRELAGFRALARDLEEYKKKLT